MTALKICEWCAAAEAISRFCSESCYRAWSFRKPHAYPVDQGKPAPVSVSGVLVPYWRELMAVQATWQAKRPSARSQGDA